MDDNAPVTRPTPAGNRTRDLTKPQTGPQGPYAAPVVLGLLAVTFAGLVIAKEAMSWSVDWSRFGPAVIVGAGIVMVVIGVIGLVRRDGSS
jgi:hypothetical protein